MGATGVSAENSPFLRGSEEVELNERNPAAAPLLRPRCPQRPGGGRPADQRGGQAPVRSVPDGAGPGGQCFPRSWGRWQLVPEVLGLVENLRLPVGRGGEERGLSRGSREAVLRSVWQQGLPSLASFLPSFLPDPGLWLQEWACEQPGVCYSR